MPASVRVVRSVGEAMLAVLVASIYFAYVFRLPGPLFLSSGLGDWGDPYFINFLLEHWHTSLTRLSDPSSPPMFFPVPRTLGYSHGLILFVPFYSTARLLSGPLAAYNLMLLLVMVSGSASLFLFLRHGLRTQWFVSMALTILFFTSRNVVNGGTAVWAQRASVFLIPPLLLSALIAFRLRTGRWKTGAAFLAGLLAALLFIQDFYTAQLSILVLVLLGLGAAIIARKALTDWSLEVWKSADSPQRPSRWWLIASGVLLLWSFAILILPIPKTSVFGVRVSATNASRPFLLGAIAGIIFLSRLYGAFRDARTHDRHISLVNPISVIARSWKQQRASVAAASAGGVMGSVVFLWIYLGSFLEHRSFPVEQLMEALTTVSVGNGQVEWSAVLRAYDSVRMFGWLTAVAALAWIPAARLGREPRLYLLWMVFLSCLIWSFGVRVNDFSSWNTLLRPVPGFSVIRDPKRIMPIYELFTIIAVAFLAARMSRPWRVAVAVMACLSTALAWNPERFDYGRDVRTFDEWVKAPVAIDASCRSFFVIKASDAYMARSSYMWPLYATDAGFIALEHSIPTLNGYSAWTPDGWRLANPQEASYSHQAAGWMALQNLQNVCQLDLQTRRMTPTPLTLPR